VSDCRTTAVEHEPVSTVLTHLKEGEITEAIAYFGESFQFRDWGIGVEFKNPRRLAEFFRKARELYPDSSLETESIIACDEQVIIEWTARTTIPEPFYGGLSREVQGVLHGVSVVQTVDGKIIEWTDYYDGRTSRRTALAAHFEEWIEL
jgi:hypothetical protein